MSRALFGLTGTLLALMPVRATRVYEAVAFENPEACERTESLLSLVRAEGLVFAIVAVLGGRSYDRLLDVTGVFGAIAFCFPRQYLETGARLAYENDDELEFREGFVTAARLLGAAFLALSARACLRRKGEL